MMALFLTALLLEAAGISVFSYGVFHHVELGNPNWVMGLGSLITMMGAFLMVKAKPVVEEWLRRW